MISGPSGSGKSQLLRTLAGLRPLQHGTIRLGGRSPQKWGLPRWRAEVCYLSQRPQIFAATAAAQLERLPELSGQKKRAPWTDPIPLAERWGLPPERWEAPWLSLSGGEQQRLALAMTLASAPQVLLLDEPSSALDPQTKAAVEADLLGKTALWISHDPEQHARISPHGLKLGAEDA